MMMQLAANPSDLSKMMRISGLTRRQINHFAHYLPRQADTSSAYGRSRSTSEELGEESVADEPPAFSELLINSRQSCLFTTYIDLS